MRIKEIRASKKIQQKDLAKALGIGANTLSQYETGKREPDLMMLQKIADELGVSVDYLLGRPEQKGEPAPREGDGLRTMLLVNFEALNQEGRERLVETSDDMVSSGKYKKSFAPGLGQAAEG